jgi:hypothetical protein
MGKAETRRIFNWYELQEALMKATTEEEVKKIMEDEESGPKRLRWILRMQGRLGVLRRERENVEILRRVG